MKSGKDSIEPKNYLKPISEKEPCGPNLEYDSEYVALQTRMIPKGDVQYGDFVKAPETPNWREIGQECLQMLSRTRDIPILLLLLRCRLHLVQARGLREILEILLEWLEHYPEHVHPQILIEGEQDPTVRANALLALVDYEGVLGDLRELVLSKSSAMRLQIRDVERAFAVPRLSDALAPESVRRQLNDLYRADDANVLALTEAAKIARRLSAWLTVNMKEDAPDLKVFFHLMSLFDRDESGAKDVPEELSSDTEPEIPQALQKTMASPLSPEKARDTALQSIRNVREWFEQYEPSSPVSVLLRQAELMIGKKFYEVAQAIPSDLLERWSNDSSS
ncbi:hypothetical protein AGMMS50289_21920 [Betaproteobacteria bacterium]|nr:hypothetical protein AGMMS50289_21920 [Betaproteobacteria bacterium]